MGDRHFAPRSWGWFQALKIYKHFAATRLRKINETPVSPFGTLNSQKTFLHLTKKYPNSSFRWERPRFRPKNSCWRDGISSRFSPN